MRTSSSKLNLLIQFCDLERIARLDIDRERHALNIE